MTELTIIVAIATSGRRDILAEVIDIIASQSRPPDRILVCPARPEDVDTERLPHRDISCAVVEGVPGLPSQRNALLTAAGDSDLVIFFDDDFLPEHRYLEATEKLFARHPNVVAATGDVVVDGILGAGLSVADGRRHLAELGRPGPENLLDVYNAYGCNMAIRMAPVREMNLRFDETLPLYGWLEDVDFCRRLQTRGQIVKSMHLRGVHLGAKSGRGKGNRLGYSQIANPVYMVGKGTFTRRRAAAQIGRNVLANTIKSIRPEPWVDRRGRLRGNFAAFRDIVRGRLHPRRILDMH